MFLRVKVGWGGRKGSHVAGSELSTSNISCEESTWTRDHQLTSLHNIQLVIRHWDCLVEDMRERRRAMSGYYSEDDGFFSSSSPSSYSGCDSVDEVVERFKVYRRRLRGWSISVISFTP